MNIEKLNSINQYKKSSILLIIKRIEDFYYSLAAVVIPNVIGVILMTKKCREIKKDFFDNEKYCPKKIA